MQIGIIWEASLKYWYSGFSLEQINQSQVCDPHALDVGCVIYDGKKREEQFGEKGKTLVFSTQKFLHSHKK